MDQFDKYNDENGIELFPDGKIFRLQYDSSVRKMKIICKKHDLFEDLRNAFSAPNNSSFFMSQYGYKTESKLYAINKFGYFSPGLVFEILQYIKQNYGSLSVLALTRNCKQYIDDIITPLKSFFVGKEKIVSNISDDLGRNNELAKNGKTEYKFRDY